MNKLLQFQAAMLPLPPQTAEMGIDEMLGVIQRNHEQAMQLLRSSSQDIVRMTYFQSCASVQGIRDHVNRSVEQDSIIQHHNGANGL